MSRRAASSLAALVLLLGACASEGEPYVAPTTPTTAAPTDDVSRLAAERANRAGAAVDALFACPTPSNAPSAEAFAVAFVAPSDASRELIAPLPLPELGDPAAQLRALLDDAATCPGAPTIELHVHRDYDLADPNSLAGLCDDVVRNERNDLVIARGLPPESLTCVADELPTLLLGDAPADLARHLVVLGADSDAQLTTLVSDAVDAGMVVPDRPGIGLLRASTTPVDADALDTVTEAIIDDDPDLGCLGIDDARAAFDAADVGIVVSLLGPACLSSTALGLKSLGAQWVIGPLGVGTGDDAIASISAIGTTLSGAYAVTATPRAAIVDRVPAAPPVLGERCAAVTAVEGEDYAFGILEYAALEELCVAARLTVEVAAAAPTTAADAVAIVTAHDELPWSSNLLAGFDAGATVAFDGSVVYVQRYSAGCACWTYVSGPIARG